MVQDTNSLHLMLNRFVAEFRAVDAELDLLNKRRRGLQNTIMGLREMIEAEGGEVSDEVYDEDEEPEEDDGPRLRGKAAVWEIFRRNPGVPFNAAQMLDALEEEGWAPDSQDPEAVLRVTIRRLMNDQTEISRVGYGLYAYEPDES